MKSPFIAMCLVKIGELAPFVCVAPSWSIHKGDTVVLEGGDVATVLAVDTVTLESDTVNLLTALYGYESIKDFTRITQKCYGVDDPFKQEEEADVPSNE